MQRLAILALLFLLPACDGPQSAMTGSGPESARVLLLTWIMTIGSAAILALVCGLTGIAMFGPQRWKDRLRSHRLIVSLGIVFPVVTLTILLFYGFAIMRVGTVEGRAENPVRIEVVGEQWWWRVRYPGEDGTVETANELRVPVGRQVEVTLTTADVLHSFWVPAYAGKVDMVPGRETVIHFTANEPGLVRGQCAEYCGGAHALMAFQVEALPEEEFAAWLDRERGPAVSAQGEGAQVFLESGCGACHTVRGTPAAGRVGPDLTHVGNRHMIGAATLPATQDGFARWIAGHRQIKPDNLMPPFEFLTEQEIAQMAAWLEGLE